jgi:hypothetical protein
MLPMFAVFGTQPTFCGIFYYPCRQLASVQLHGKTNRVHAAGMCRHSCAVRFAAQKIVNQKSKSYDSSLKIQHILYYVTLALYALCLVATLLMFVVSARRCRQASACCDRQGSSLSLQFTSSHPSDYLELPQ